MLLCIHVSGFRGKLKRSLEAMKKTAALCSEQFHILYNDLSDKVPTMEQVSSFVKPLQYMLLELYKQCCEEDNSTTTLSSSGELYLKSLRFIYENYSQPINCDALAKETDVLGIYLKKDNTVLNKDVMVVAKGEYLNDNFLIYFAIFLMLLQSVQLKQKNDCLSFCGIQHYPIPMRIECGLFPYLRFRLGDEQYLFDEQ